MPPTVITGLKDSSRCMQEEIFGPVVCVTKFSGDDEGDNFFKLGFLKEKIFFRVPHFILILSVSTESIVQRANDVPYGLCASVWSENAGRIHRVASKLKVT